MPALARNPRVPQMMPDLEAALRSILEEIVGSDAARKIVVAGPGTGKTTLFRRLLEAGEGPRDGRLVLTFINNLRAELDEALGELARVFTFHGYCRRLLHRSPELRAGLTEGFRYYPPLPTLIESDWSAARGRPVPKLVGLMRRLEPGAATAFSLERGDYYDAVSFDDSVFRIQRALEAHPDQIEAYETVLIDEYQDFNAVEAALLDLLATRSPIVIAGDDDQALHSLLRSSSPEFIRARYGGGAYARFALPFCMRCPEVIVRAVGDVVERARGEGRLGGRIAKPYEPYPPGRAWIACGTRGSGSSRHRCRASGPTISAATSRRRSMRFPSRRSRRLMREDSRQFSWSVPANISGRFARILRRTVTSAGDWRRRTGRDPARGGACHPSRPG